MDNINIIFRIIIWGAAIIAFIVMRTKRSQVPEGIVDNSPLLGLEKIYVPLLALASPVLAGLIFYYGWKKRLPQKAKTANLFSLIGFVIFMTIISFS